MPVDMSKYPDNWSEIRERVLRRAGGHDPDPRYHARCEWCNAENYNNHPETGSRVVLTIAHIYDPDPMNVDMSNLAALCQKCHNGHDAKMRATNRAIKQRKQEIENGQLILLRVDQ